MRPEYGCRLRRLIEGVAGQRGEFGARHGHEVAVHSRLTGERQDRARVVARDDLEADAQAAEPRQHLGCLWAEFVEERHKSQRFKRRQSRLVAGGEGAGIRAAGEEQDAGALGGQRSEPLRQPGALGAIGGDQRRCQRLECAEHVGSRCLARKR